MTKQTQFHGRPNKTKLFGLIEAAAESTAASTSTPDPFCQTNPNPRIGMFLRK
jgi:hypothetical protein